MRGETPVEIRRVQPEDWPRTRVPRLEALAGTPIGFLDTLAEAQRADDRTWQQRAARGAEGGDSFQVVAWAGGLEREMVLER